MPRPSIVSEGIELRNTMALTVNYFTPQRDSELNTIAEVPWIHGKEQ